MKTTKGGKVMNPTDAYRKELRKKELKRNKKERKKVREVGILKKDPEAIKEQIRKLEMMKADGALDKTRRHKKRQLEDTLNLVIKKRKEYEDKMREKGEDAVMFSHLPATRRRATAEEEERAKHPKPEDSVYFHPSLNPSGAPPPGKPPMYKSAIGPRIPLSSDGKAPSSSEQPTGPMPPPPPPPPPPMPTDVEGKLPAVDPFVSLPVPLPPPAPSSEPNTPLTSVLLPPPHQGFPPSAGSPLRPLQPPPPGTVQDKLITVSTIVTDDDLQSDASEQTALVEDQALSALLSPLHRRPSPMNVHDEERAEFSTTKELTPTQGLPPPPPLRPPGPSPLRSSAVSVRAQHGPPSLSFSAEDLPPGVTRLPPPPPPPPGLRPGMSLPPPPPQGLPPPMMVPPPGPPPSLPSRQHLVPPTPTPVMRPPPGPPPIGSSDSAGLAHAIPTPLSRISDGSSSDDTAKAGSSRPSYVKSAAATVVKRPLAQHTPELTSMVPASVRVRRENALKFKPKAPSTVGGPLAHTTPKPTPKPPAMKPQSIDDSYYAFLEDMKALGAFDEGERPY